MQNEVAWQNQVRGEVYSLANQLHWLSVRLPDIWHLDIGLPDIWHLDIWHIHRQDGKCLGVKNPDVKCLEVKCLGGKCLAAVCQSTKIQRITNWKTCFVASLHLGCSFKHMKSLCSEKKHFQKRRKGFFHFDNAGILLFRIPKNSRLLKMLSSRFSCMS